MKNINNILICLTLLLASCATDDTVAEPVINTLADLVAINDVEIDNVIACASGSAIDNEFIAYVFPRPGSSELRYFETEDATVDKNDFSNYRPIEIEPQGLFNEFLMTFTRQTEVEKWVIISFRESGIIHLSNPIRLKHQTQNTLLGSEVAINQNSPGEPIFNWAPIVSNNDAIYFQVVSDASDNLLSGTYTFDSQFQFYRLDNVVLNVTPQDPPALIEEDLYQFTLMAVSEDNWVNYLALEIPFVAQ